MTAQSANVRDANGDWHPPEPIRLPPIVSWPLRPRAVVKWMFGFPGFLWPMNSLWLALTLATWFFFTPDLAAMQSFELWWITLLLVRNLVLVAIVMGGLHLFFFTLKKQGDDLKFSDKPLATNNRRFLFRDQVRDNMFRTLCAAVPILTAYEAITYWLFANGYIGFLGLEPGGVAFWAWFVALLLLAPVIHGVHFYFTHRLRHWRPLYKAVHRVHHLNVEVGPWSGLAMHPVELAIYFSTVCVQWLLALHPVNALFQIQIAIYNAAVSHSGFERLRVGGLFDLEVSNYFHYLHHRYFECNYGGVIAPMDQLFGTFHDGSADAHKAMRQRMLARLGDGT